MAVRALVVSIGQAVRACGVDRDVLTFGDRAWHLAQVRSMLDLAVRRPLNSEMILFDPAAGVDHDGRAVALEMIRGADRLD
jgi:hypothetical protein